MAESYFWQPMLLYLYRPNLINKRLIGAQLLSSWCLSQDISLTDIIQLVDWQNFSREKLISILNLSAYSKQILLDDLLKLSSSLVILRKLFRKQSLKVLQKQACEQSLTISDSEYDILILFPKDNLFVSIPIFFDETTGIANIIRNNTICFAINLNKPNGNLNVEYLFDFTEHYWLENILKPKLEQWMKTSQQSDNTDNNSFQGSIKNISVEIYCQNYNRMKAKYSIELLEIWSKVEKTNPIKFIFEDIAIAAYLVTLWQEEQAKFKLKERQTFADIGCGNGLLVYILTNEGYQGYGVDVRKRNIWDYYGPNVRLIEMQINLFDENDDFKLPPCDWMIGNHSDELTPWIVYMASSVSSFTRAFVLPCCCFDFDGFKYQRSSEPNKSQYQCYIDYLQRLGEDFGFKCFRDKLRIPSTKRICLVCYDRYYLDRKTISYDQMNGEQIEAIKLLEINLAQKRRQIIKKCLQTRSTQRLREKEELVRNCTRIDQQTKNRIIDRIASALNDAKSRGVEPALSFSEAIQLIDSEMRVELKNQCGGLQTFIRNHRHIFTISNFKIRFQDPKLLRAVSGRSKSKKCWFFHHYPEGCPWTATECAYRHSAIDSPKTITK